MQIQLVGRTSPTLLLPRCTCLPPRQHCTEVALGETVSTLMQCNVNSLGGQVQLSYRLVGLASQLVNIALELHLEEEEQVHLRLVQL